jgi:hypothetical protein
MLELAALGIASFLVGFVICALFLAARLSLRDITRNPLFWFVAILHGVVIAGAFSSSADSNALR